MISQKQSPLWLAFVVIFFLITLLGVNVYLFGEDASYGPNQISLLTIGIIVSAIGRFYLKIPYKDSEQMVINSISAAIPACFILLMVGPLISLWIIGGVVPGIIYYGLELIRPSFFLPVACLSCAMVSVSIGSSWSTMGTIGVALIGVGQALGIPPGLSAGAIISGAYFGDKMSALSDTTNLAPAVAGIDLFTHIKYMSLTTVPAMILSLILFTMIGLTTHASSEVSVENIHSIQMALKDTFHISGLIFIPPIVVLILVSKKTPPLPALFIGALAGGVSALTIQPQLIEQLEVNGIKGQYSLLMTAAHSGIEFQTKDESLNTLLSRGGMASMLPTVWLILSAMFFGGALESTGMLKRIAQGFLKLVSGTGSLVGSTIAACLTLNMTASDQYLAIVIPGKMFKKSYNDYQLKEVNLSRSLEDGATMTSVMIPWNTCGAYASGVLGVSPLSYAPYCFFNILSPVMSLFFASMNIMIQKKINSSP